MKFLKKRLLGRMAVFCVLISLFATQSALARSKGQSALDLGTKLYHEGRYREAAKSFEDATKLDPGLLKAWKNLGRAYYKSGKTKEALRVWQTILKVEPGNLEIRNSVGFLHMAKSQWRRAIPHLATSLKSDPDQNLVRIRLGKAYKEIEQYDRAVKLFEHALRIQPNDLDALIPLADVYEKFGEQDLAISIYKNYISSPPKVIAEEEKNRIAGRLSGLLAKKGNELFRKGQFQRAETFYIKALSLRPDNKRVLLNLGWALEKQGEYNEAVKAWLKTVDKGYTGFQLFHQIANAYYHSGQIGKAQTWYHNAAGIDPSNDLIQFRLFELAMSRKENFNALTALQNVFAETGADQAWSLRAGDLFIRNGGLDQGVEFFLQRLSLSSNQETTKKVLGKLYIKIGSREREAGNIRKAIYNYEKALYYETNNATIYRDLGWLYWQKGKQESTQKIWKQYRNKFPNDSEPHNLLARLYLFQGSYKNSLRAVKRSLEIKENQPEQKLLQVKALFWNKRYAQAMQKTKLIAQEYPDHLPIQYFYGEVLMRYQDFKRGEVQWRKVLDMGSDSPSANFYWIKSLYETGNYQGAVHEARKFLDSNEPYAPILKLLRDDAIFREDNQEAIFWQEKLLDHFRDDAGQWLKMARLYKEEDALNQANSTLGEAQKKFPTDVRILLAIGDLRFNEGRVEEALAVFNNAIQIDPNARRAFFGKFHSLIALERMDEATQHLQSGHHIFLKEYELDLKMGNVMEAMNDPAKAKTYYSRVAKPHQHREYIPILHYNGLSDHPRNGYLWIKKFENQIKSLADRGYTTVTMAELGNILKSKLVFPEKPILIIFDGGSRDVFQLGDPVLKKYDMKATMFVPTTRIYEEEPLFAGWEKIRQYEESGRWDIQIRENTISNARQPRNGNFRLIGTGNKTKIAKIYQFEFIQDRTGYNRMEPGDTQTSQLRRFSVPRNWDGDQLVQHLAETHPSYLAQLALAKSEYWNGQVSDAEKVFSDLVAHEPRLKNKIQIYLADISYQGGNYWESEKLLQDIPIEEFDLNPKVEKLKQAVAWKTRPRVFGGFEFFHDSNDRTNHSESARIYFPLKFPLELMLEGAIVNFEEEGRRNLDGNEVTAGINWSGWKSFRLDGKFRNRYISQKNRSQSYWASAEYLKKQHKVEFNWSDRDIDTVQAIENGIQVKTYRLGYQTRFSPPLLGKVSLSYQDYDDGNTAFDITTRLRYTLPELKNWKFGADLSYKDSDFEAPAYYTPDQLLIGLARVFYQRQISKKFELRADYGFGGASDKVNGVRWVTKGSVKMGYRVSRQLKAGLAAKFSVVPGYNSVNLQAFIGYRF
ncbi:MAG: tetratricopeptide repeat protein [Nitrospinae bacterium]|nr:tetratricopeptide repeat protein [Nitrospinota bacterium]